jgi:hypothetical protein
MNRYDIALNKEPVSKSESEKRKHQWKRLNFLQINRKSDWHICRYCGEERNMALEAPKMTESESFCKEEE